MTSLNALSLSLSLVLLWTQGSTSEGVLLGTYSSHAPQNTLALHVVHNVQDPDQAQYGRGLEDTVGTTLYRISNPDPPILREFLPHAVLLCCDGDNRLLC